MGAAIRSAESKIHCIIVFLKDPLNSFEAGHLLWRIFTMLFGFKEIKIDHNYRWATKMLENMSEIVVF